MAVRVLVADDDQDLLDLVEWGLRQSGMEVVRATTGVDVLDLMVEEGPFDVVITDIQMPWMSGMQAAHSIREAGFDTPVIVITALRDPTLPERVRALGPRTLLLTKPFDIDQLIAAVASVLGEEPALTETTLSSTS